MTRTKKNVLVLCTGNSARSQMLEAILRAKLGDRVESASAGTEPAPRVNPFAIRALSEIGIEHEAAPPKTPDAFGDRTFDVVVTVCDHAKETCPILPGAPKTLHIGYPDPAAVEGTDDVILQAFREVRDHMVAWCELFQVVVG
jgi:arsenate reductase